MDNDGLAYLLLKAKQLIVLQTICEFNVWWMHDISPLVMKDATIDFLVDNKDHFKRKINVGEFMEFDCIIYHKRPETFKEFKQLVKTSDLKFR